MDCLICSPTLSLLRPDKGRMKANSEPITAIIARVTPYRIATVLPDCFDRYHKSNSASPQNSARMAVRARLAGKRRLNAVQKLRKMPLDEPSCSSRAISQAADVDAPIVTTGMEKTVQATLIMAMSPMVLIRSLKGLS